MKKISSILFLSLIISAFFSFPAYAIDFKASEVLVVTEPINDDYYAAGGNIEINAPVNGDLYMAGGVLTVNADIAGDLVVAGGKITIKGSIGDDVRVFGGQVTIFGNVEDDVIAAGGQLDISKNSIIKGSLLCGAGIITMDGEVKENVRGAVGMLMLNGKVGGDVIVIVEEKLSVSEAAQISGNVKYSALIDMEVPQNAVKGQIEFNKFEQKQELKQVTNAYFIYKIFSYLSALLITLLLIFIFTNTMLKSAENTKKDPLKTFGYGVVVIIAGFIGSLLLMITIIGIPLGLMGFAALVIMGYLAKIFVAAWLTSYIVDLKKSNNKYFKIKLFFGCALMLFVYYLVSLIPYIGWLLDIILFLIGIGSMAIVKKEGMDFMKAKKML